MGIGMIGSAVNFYGTGLRKVRQQSKDIYKQGVDYGTTAGLPKPVVRLTGGLVQMTLFATYAPTSIAVRTVVGAAAVVEDALNYLKGANLIKGCGCGTSVGQVKNETSGYVRTAFDYGLKLNDLYNPLNVAIDRQVRRQIIDQIRDPKTDISVIDSLVREAKTSTAFFGRGQQKLEDALNTALVHRQEAVKSSEADSIKRLIADLKNPGALGEENILFYTNPYRSDGCLSDRSDCNLSQISGSDQSKKESFDHTLDQSTNFTTPKTGKTNQFEDMLSTASGNDNSAASYHLNTPDKSNEPVTDSVLQRTESEKKNQGNPVTDTQLEDGQVKSLTVQPESPTSLSTSQQLGTVQVEAPTSLSTSQQLGTVQVDF